MADVRNPRSRHTGELSRRELLQTGLTGGMAVAAAAAMPAPLRGSDDKGAPRIPPFELEEATVAQLQAEMGAGMRTARSLVEAYIARSEALDPRLRAVIEVNPEAVAIATSLDDERKAKGPRGPLHGIPVLIKDNISTADRMATTAGSLALIGAKAPRDSSVAGRLRLAGAVIARYPRMAWSGSWRNWGEQ